jgi:hypothetical protein
MWAPIGETGPTVASGGGGGSVLSELAGVLSEALGMLATILVAGATIPADTVPAKGGSLEKLCEGIHEDDTRECGRLKSSKARAICRASAMERYAACLTGKRLPPLVKRPTI